MDFPPHVQDIHLDRKTNVSFKNGEGKINTSKNYTRGETTIFWTLDTRKGKTKTTGGRKNRRDKRQRKAKQDLDK